MDGSHRQSILFEEMIHLTIVHFYKIDSCKTLTAVNNSIANDKSILWLHHINGYEWSKFCYPLL